MKAYERGKFFSINISIRKGNLFFQNGIDKGKD